MRKLVAITCMLILLFAASACAENVTGYSYDFFLERYAENIDFINDNAGRMMLPLIPAKQDAGWGDGREYRVIGGEWLTMEMLLEPINDVIESCRITLTAPADLAYGSSTYRDFSTSGYQSYALLMAMDPGETAYDRYHLVTDVESWLATGNDFQKQIGVYNLIVSRTDNVVTMVFTNSTATPTPTPVPPETPVPTPTETPVPEE
ncbi:MAG: hypothetical protein IKK08_07630 [Clostridia bacterium]|nr:hypothetical protein [Clostridia bacterium]